MPPLKNLPNLEILILAHNKIEGDWVMIQNSTRIKRLDLMTFLKFWLIRILATQTNKNLQTVKKSRGWLETRRFLDQTNRLGATYFWKKIERTKRTTSQKQSSNGRKIGRIPRNSTIFGPNESSRHNLFLEKCSKERNERKVFKKFENFRIFSKKISYDFLVAYITDPALHEAS